MKLIVVRHGETEDNRAGILEGHLPGSLSEIGRRQVEKLAERLKDEKIDLIISSDLARALDTANMIAKFHPEINLITDVRLRERNLRASQGKTLESVNWNNPPKDMETKKEMRSRVFELFEETLEKHPSKTIVFVAHGGINRALIRMIYEGELNDSLGWREQENTCMNVFDVDELGNVKTVLLNCSEHLK